MADDAARSRLGRGLASLIGDVGAEVAVDRARARAASARCRSNTCAPIRAIRASCSPTPSSTSCPTRSASAASSSRSWCARAAPTASRSSPASGAGARRSAPACTRCRSSCSTSPTAKRSSSRSSRTSSAADLNPLEEATGYQSLANEFNHSQDDIAKIVGKSRSHIANTLRLLKLPETVKAYINSGKLTAGHARMLVGQPNAEELARPDRQARVSTCARSRRWRARAGRGQARETKRAGRLGKDADTEALENAADRCARPAGRHRSSRQRRRHAAGALSHARAARRRHPAAGVRPRPADPQARASRKS